MRTAIKSLRRSSAKPVDRGIHGGSGWTQDHSGGGKRTSVMLNIGQLAAGLKSAVKTGRCGSCQKRFAGMKSGGSLKPRFKKYCARCKLEVCDECAKGQAVLPGEGDKPKRVCPSCIKLVVVRQVSSTGWGLLGSGGTSRDLRVRPRGKSKVKMGANPMMRAPPPKVVKRGSTLTGMLQDEFKKGPSRRTFGAVSFVEEEEGEDDDDDDDEPAPPALAGSDVRTASAEAVAPAVLLSAFILAQL